MVSESWELVERNAENSMLMYGGKLYKEWGKGFNYFSVICAQNHSLQGEHIKMMKHAQSLKEHL